MPGQKGPLFSFDRQVAKVEIELRPWIRMTVNSQFGPRVPGLKVMISSNQVDFEIRHLFSPSIKFLANDLRSAISCVEEVTEQNKGVCFCPLDQILNALAILGGGGFGYGYSGLAESRRFSEMGVGNQKRLLVRPVDRFPEQSSSWCPCQTIAIESDLLFKRNPPILTPFSLLCLPRIRCSIELGWIRPIAERKTE